jgi:Tol biopolymer transport system component
MSTLRNVFSALTISALLLAVLALTGGSVSSARNLAHASGAGTASRASQASHAPRELAVGQGESGGLIAFAAGGEIFVMNADGSGLKQLTVGVAGVHNYQPALSPDGTRVAFSSNLGNKGFDIYVVSVGGKGLRRLTSDVKDENEPAWSPDGTKIAFVRGNDATIGGVVVMSCMSSAMEILVVGVDDGTPEVSLTKGLGGTDPAWSPDGTRIAFASAREGNLEIYTMSSDGDGESVKRLTDTGWAEGDPAWSPDGSRIAYAAKLHMDGVTMCGNMPVGGLARPDGNGPYIYSLMADGGGQQKIKVTGSNAEPAWSPGGSEIIFVGGLESDPQLYLISASGGSALQLTFDPVEKSSPSWAEATKSR